MLDHSIVSCGFSLTPRMCQVSLCFTFFVKYLLHHCIFYILLYWCLGLFYDKLKSACSFCLTILHISKQWEMQKQFHHHLIVFISNSCSKYVNGCLLRIFLGWRWVGEEWMVSMVLMKQDFVWDQTGGPLSFYLSHHNYYSDCKKFI